MFWFRKNIDPECSDEALMTYILKGNKKALEYLYDRYFQKLVWYVNGFVKNNAIAEDIVQEVFIKIMDTPEKFDATKKFSTWVYTVSGNLAKNYLRNEELRQQKLKVHARENAAASERQNHQMDANLIHNKMAEIISQFSEKEKAIYTLRFEQQFSIRDISEALNIPEGSVKSGIYYLLKKFSNKLNYQIHEN